MLLRRLGRIRTKKRLTRSDRKPVIINRSVPIQRDAERMKETEKETDEILSQQENKTRKETPEADGRLLVIATGGNYAIGPSASQ